MFSKRKSSENGLSLWCKDCNNSYKKEWLKTTSFDSKLYSKKYHFENKERHRFKKSIYSKLRYIKNKEHILNATNSYKQKFPEKRNALQNKRRSLKLLRCPKWLKEEHFSQIDLLYSKAKSLGNLLNVKFHVDHVIPLVGKNVSGLHVPWNLQLLEASINLRKHSTNIFMLVDSSLIGVNEPNDKKVG